MLHVLRHFSGPLIKTSVSVLASDAIKQILYRYIQIYRLYVVYTLFCRFNVKVLEYKNILKTLKMCFFGGRGFIARLTALAFN